MVGANPHHWIFQPLPFTKPPDYRSCPILGAVTGVGVLSFRAREEVSSEMTQW